MGSASTKQVVSPSPVLESSPVHSLKVITYNTFLRPHIVQNDAQVERSLQIPGMLKMYDADVVCLQECWSKFGTRNIIRLLRAQGYMHIVKTKKVKKFRLMHAGLITCSKHPIVYVEFVPFEVCSGTDCLATKGFLYTQIAHPQLGTIHVFNLHLQFVTATRLKSNDLKKLEVQQEQLKKWQEFMAQRQISSQDVVILAGDWNFDCVNNETEFQQLLEGLQLHLPTRVGDQQVSVDPEQNTLVGRGNEARKYGCVSVLYTGESCSCCPSRWVDFVVYSGNHRQPVSSVCEIQKVVVPPFRTRWTSACTALSDHYPVVCEMQF
jgi:endonuclease/exonuclease/phosphatase family metal-dependent hydrolase